MITKRETEKWAGQFVKARIGDATIIGVVNRICRKPSGLYLCVSIRNGIGRWVPSRRCRVTYCGYSG